MPAKLYTRLYIYICIIYSNLQQKNVVQKTSKDNEIFEMCRRKLFDASGALRLFNIFMVCFSYFVRLASGSSSGQTSALGGQMFTEMQILKMSALVFF